MSSPSLDPIPPGLAPESRAIFAMAGELGLLDYDTGTVAGLRALTRAERPMLGEAPELSHIENREIGSPGGPLPIRIYRPPGETPERAILWLHGGGWVVGDLDQADNDCRGLCLETGSTVVSVGYRLAPEHPFPAGLEDAYAALGWLAERLAGEPVAPQLVVGGDSAGGNLAAALCLMARARGGPRIKHQLLVYPVTGCGCDTTSYREFAEGYLLTRETMLRFWTLYAGAQDPRDPLASVLLAPAPSGLPAATFVVAGCDVLRDDAEAYAERLAGAGVAVRVLRYPGQLHGFWSYRGASKIAADVNAEIRASLDAGR